MIFFILRADGRPIQDRDISSIPSIRRNPVLADIFDRLGFMERQGSGLGKIREGYELLANFKTGKEPVFASSPSEFVVSFPNLNFEIQKDGALNDNEKNILSYLRLNERATQKQLSEEFCISRRTVQRIIKSLQDMKLLVRAGSKNHGYWVVKCDE